MSEEKKEIYVCRCEEVTEEMVRQAVRDGALTVDAVKKRTRAGMGFCQGRTCRRLCGHCGVYADWQSRIR